MGCYIEEILQVFALGEHNRYPEAGLPYFGNNMSTFTLSNIFNH